MLVGGPPKVAPGRISVQIAVRAADSGARQRLTGTTCRTLILAARMI
jgi:hypothetical protein